MLIIINTRLIQHATGLITALKWLVDHCRLTPALIFRVIHKFMMTFIPESDQSEPNSTDQPNYVFMGALILGPIVGPIVGAVYDIHQRKYRDDNADHAG